MSPKLSVVLGTLDRLPLLVACLASIRASCGRLTPEIIVVDGGSTDGTVDYLAERTDVRAIFQGRRLGAVAAFNAGFAVASGRYVAALNDDCLVAGQTLARACDFLDNRPGVGQAAIPFSDPRHAPAVDYVTVGTPPRAYLYANFGVTRRELGESLGWWGPDLQHYGGDTELSLKIWRTGLTVAVLAGGHIQHLRAQDETRLANERHSTFTSRWESWDGRPERKTGERS